MHLGTVLWMLSRKFRHHPRHIVLGLRPEKGRPPPVRRSLLNGLLTAAIGERAVEEYLPAGKVQSS
jgi:hypothetical protein